MLAYLVLAIALLSRFVPHLLHGVGLNFTAIGGGLLFFGARRPRWQALVAAAACALSDVCLTCLVYGYPFHTRSYLVTWAWYAGVCLVGSALLRRITVGRVVLATLASSSSFFLLSNFEVWLQGDLYAHTLQGIAQCYLAAIPFYANDLVSTGMTAGVLFGLPFVAAMLVHTWRNATQRQQWLP